MNSNRFKYSSTWVHLSKLFKLKHETNNSLKLNHLSVNLLSHPLQQLKINQPTNPQKNFTHPTHPPKKNIFPIKNKNKTGPQPVSPPLHRTVSYSLPRLVRRRKRPTDEGTPSQLRLFEATLTRQAFHRTTEVASVDRWMAAGGWWVWKGGMGWWVGTTWKLGKVIHVPTQRCK